MTTTTTWIMIVTALLWIIWDIYLYVRKEKHPETKTISVIITEFSYYSPMLPFIAGLLCGHWFWPQ